MPVGGVYGKGHAEYVYMNPELNTHVCKTVALFISPLKCNA